MNRKLVSFLSLVAFVALPATGLGFASWQLAGSAPALESLCGHAVLAAKALRTKPVQRTIRIVENTADTDVLRYSLELEPLFSNENIVGTNLMQVESKVADLTSFTFRIGDTFVLSRLELDGRPVTFTRLDSATVRANFDRPYAAGEVFQLFVAYSGSTTPGQGFGSINFRTRSSGALEAWTLSEPWFAYTWWPAKDINEDKAIVDMAVIVPTGLSAASNGLLQSVNPMPGGRNRYHWSSQYPITPYLVSFNVSNYNTWTQSYSGTGQTMPVQFFVYPEHDTSGNRAGWNASVQMITTFATRFGEYPFLSEKYGIVEFGFGGGMEHQTITGQGGFGESLTAHELAHQWWGDMITCRFWEDIWLNEGFATYAEALWLEAKPGSSGLPALKAAMQARKPSSVNGTVYCYDSGNVSAIFNSNFSYRKGSWVLHQLRHIVGDSTFFAILAEWRERHQYGAATTEDFIAASEFVYGGPLRWFFDPWIYERGALAYRWGNQIVTVSGRKYLVVHLRQVQSATYPRFTMPVDLRFTVLGEQITRSLWNFAELQHYVVPIANTATAPLIDPDGWLLTTSVTTEAYSPGPPKIVTVLPPPGPGADSDFSKIKVTFHTPVVASKSDFKITSHGRPMPFVYTYDAPNCTAILTLGVDILPSAVVLTVFDTVRAIDSGMILDGEMAPGAVLPSGDGLPGGNAVFSYTH